MNTMINYTENNDSQKPAINLLRKLGWTYIRPEETVKERGSLFSNVILEDILGERLSHINSFEYNLFNGETADPDLFRKVDVLYSRRETAMKRLDEVANNWHATFILIERAKALLSDQKSGCERQFQYD